MKKLIWTLFSATVLAVLAGFTPASHAASCTPINTITTVGSFGGEICVDSEAQTIHIEGTLTKNGHTYRVEATGAMILEKFKGQPLYTISGDETIIDPTASIVGNINVTASGSSLTNASTRFASKVINITLP